MTTEYHAKLFAQELSRRQSVADAEKLAGALLDAQVDLNPHQVEAALFAFKSPLSKGAILADEVGLGKTIEAGLVLAQKWTEVPLVDIRRPATGLYRLKVCGASGMLPELLPKAAITKALRS